MRNPLAWLAGVALVSIALAPMACDGEDDTSTSTTTSTTTRTTTTTSTASTTSSSSAGGTHEGGNGGQAAHGGEGGTAGAGGTSMGGAPMGGAPMGGSAGAGGGSSSALVPSLATNNLYIDCMPIVPSDPIYGWYDALYDNSAGTASAYADIVSSTLHIGNGIQTLNWSFDVTPDPGPTVPAGQTMTTMQVKAMNTGMGMGMGAPCDYCNGTWTLEVVWTVGSQQVTDTLGPEPVSCVF